MSAMDIFNNRQGGISFIADGYIKKNDGGLKDVHTHQFLDQVVFCNHGIKADHHQNHIEPIIVFCHDQGQYIRHIFTYSPSSCLPAETILT